MADTQAIEVPNAKVGRPTLYAPDLIERVLNALRGGMLLREVAREEWAPDQTTIWQWGEKYPEFALALASARRSGAHRLAEECIPLVDSVDPDSAFGSARVSKAREQAGLRRWLAGCLDRETYGDKTQLDVKGQLSLLAAFVDMRPPVSEVVVDAEQVPHVVAPDGAGDE